MNGANALHPIQSMYQIGGNARFLCRPEKTLNSLDLGWYKLDNKIQTRKKWKK